MAREPRCLAYRPNCFDRCATEKSGTRWNASLPTPNKTARWRALTLPALLFATGLPRSGPLEYVVRAECLRRRHAGLNPARLVLEAHQFSQRREIRILTPRQLAAMTGQHLFLEPDLPGDVDEEPRNESTHIHCVHPPERRWGFQGG